MKQYAHVDRDAFYVSAELLGRQECRRSIVCKNKWERRHLS